MKTKSRIVRLAAILLFTAFLQSCYYVPISVYPFYRDRDLTSDAELVGDWSGKMDNNPVSIIVKQGSNDQEYYLIYYTDGKAMVYDAHLFEFNKSTFLDIIPVNKPSKDASRDEAYVLLAHGLWKVVHNKDKMQLYAMNSDALKELVARYQSRYVEVDKEIVLTGTTDEVQDILENHTSELFPTSTPTLELLRSK